MLKELYLEHIGPAPKLDIEFGPRLNLLTGDNGLGKTFLLDIAWWILTDTWVGTPARPQSGTNPGFSYSFHGSKKLWHGKFGPVSARRPKERESLPKSGLVIYMRVDGGFSVWDAARASMDNLANKGAIHFTFDTLWNGLRQDKWLLCNGLIDDWVKWQYQPDQEDTSPFSLLTRVIERLAPHPNEWMKPGKPTRVSLVDVRDIPTIELPYGNVPITEISAGMKRILSLAYLLIWTWYEHTRAAELKLLDQLPTQRLILLIDEVESHLHPQWQRSLLPAILELGQILQPKLKTQIIATTHSPLVLASVEPYFNEAQDRLFLLDLQEQTITLNQVPWVKQGDTVGWLTSTAFGLKQARSQEAEITIEAAEALMRGEDMLTFPEHLRNRSQIHSALLRLLPGHDPFWPRWLVETDFLPNLQAN